MQFKSGLLLLSTYIVSALADVTSVPDSSLAGFFADTKTVTIYDSFSVDHPHELRERGVATYSAINETGTFSESGVRSRPHDGAETIYRIGTEDHMGVFLHPNLVATGDAPIDEQLILYLDENDVLYHVGYSMSKAETQPGVLKLKIDHLRNARGPEVPMKGKVKTQQGNGRSTAQESQHSSDPIVTEEEEEVPEKTFIQKYWIYAVPLVLLMVLGGGGEQS